MSIEERATQITEFRIDGFSACRAEPGRVWTQPLVLKSRAELDEYIAALDKAAETAGLPKKKAAE